MCPVKWEETAVFGETLVFLVDVLNLPLLKAQPDPRPDSWLHCQRGISTQCSPKM